MTARLPTPRQHARFAHKVARAYTADRPLPRDWRLMVAACLWQSPTLASDPSYHRAVAAALTMLVRRPGEDRAWRRFRTDPTSCAALAEGLLPACRRFAARGARATA